MRFRAVKEINGWLADWKLGSRRGSWMRGGNGSTATRHTRWGKEKPRGRRGRQRVWRQLRSVGARGPFVRRLRHSQEHGITKVHPPCVPLFLLTVSTSVLVVLSRSCVWRLSGHRAPMTNGARNEGRGCGIDGPPIGTQRSASYGRRQPWPAMPCHRPPGGRARPSTEFENLRGAEPLD